MAQQTGTFTPPWWLRNPHLQTLWPFLFRRPRRLVYRPERLELDDGDFLDLAWHGPVDGPLILMLHGLEGSVHSHYARGIIHRLGTAGYRVCLMHFRGCSGVSNRLDRSYHSGETGDLEQVIEHLRQSTGAVHGVIGISLGGNVLLKWLGESGVDAPVGRAVAISVPFRLADAARRMNSGLSRLYQRHLVGRLQASYRRKFATRPSPLKVDIDRLDNFWRFDDQVTAPLHGFAGVDDYYAKASCRQYLGGIRAPTLIIHASDDPFMFDDTPPWPDELSPSSRLLLSPHGGHVGFVCGRWPWRPVWWLDQQMLRWFGDTPSTRGQ